MARRAHPPIHPGEILEAEFLEPLELSQYRLAKDISVPAEADQRDRARTALDHGGHRLASRALLRHERGVLAEPPDAVRPRGRSASGSGPRLRKEVAVLKRAS